MLFATTDQNQLIRFNSTNPNRLKDIRSITGLPPGQTLQGIDFRPATGDLYGVGSNSVVYRVNPRTGIAVAEGPAFTPPVAGRFFGVDFNPTVDKIRVTSDAALNLRLNVDEGTLLSNDAPLNPFMPRVVGSAYTNSSFTGHAGGDGAVRDRLLQRHAVGSEPDDQGTLTTVRRLPFDIQDQAGFDIAGRTTSATSPRACGAARASTRSTRPPAAAASPARSVAATGSSSPAWRPGRTDPRTPGAHRQGGPPRG